MRGTKELALLCWLGPAELGNFIKRQMNVRKGSGALGEVAPSSWLGLCCAWSLHPSQPSSEWPWQCLPWFGCWPRGTGPSDGSEESPVPGWALSLVSRAGTAPPCLQQPLSPCSPPPYRHQGSTPEPTRTQLFHPSVNLLHVLAFTAIQTFSTPEKWWLFSSSWYPL